MAFSEEQKLNLEPFVTNTKGDIFGLINLPEVVKGALFSKYSRSSLGLRELLLKEFIQNDKALFGEIKGTKSAKDSDFSSTQNSILAIQKAKSFYDRILDGYGDDSIGELGGAHLAIEQVSILLTKYIQDTRIGGSPLEKSTRYLRFDKKVNGDYQYYKDPYIINSEHGKLYLSTARNLFDTYSELIKPVCIALEEVMPKVNNISEKAYKSSVRAKCFDLLRGLLPAATQTNMGVFGNGRFFESLISKMHLNPLHEAEQTGIFIQTELSKMIPSFVNRSNKDHRHFKSMQHYSVEHDKILNDITQKYAVGQPETKLGVSLIDYEEDAENKLISALLYPQSNLSFSQLREIAAKMTSDQKTEIIKSVTDIRNNRRHKPNRSLEHIYYTFEVVGDFGMYRDLHRHRMLTQERQLLSTRFGYSIPSEIINAGLESKYKQALEKAADCYDKMAVSMPVQAQYIVPLSYHIKWYIKANLRALGWLIELRSTPQGHENYRIIAQNMYKLIEKKHPLLVNYLKFTDLNSYTLGRLDSEIKLDNKK